MACVRQNMLKIPQGFECSKAEEHQTRTNLKVNRKRLGMGSDINAWNLKLVLVRILARCFRFLPRRLVVNHFLRNLFFSRLRIIKLPASLIGGF